MTDTTDVSAIFIGSGHHEKSASLCVLLVMTILCVLFSGACGKSPNPKEDATITSVLASDTLYCEELAEVTDAAEASDESTNAAEQTETDIVPETQADKNAQTDLDALFGPEQIDYTIDLPPEYIGNNQIETEYTILDPEEGVTLSQEEIDRMDLLCKTMEDVTGLSFLKSIYGTDKKVTIHIHQAIGSGSADDSRKSIDIDVTCLKNPDFVATIHELVHILQYGRSISPAREPADASIWIWNP